MSKQVIKRQDFFIYFPKVFVRKPAVVKNASNSQYGEFSAMVGFYPWPGLSEISIAG